MTVNDLIKLLDTQENRYGGATGKPRELNLSINGNFCGGIESAELDGYGDGLVTEVTLDVEISDVEEYYEQEIRNKAIDEFVKEAMKQFTEFDLKHGYPTITDCKMILKEIAEKMKEVAYSLQD